jgi:hypothetical protein
VTLSPIQEALARFGATLSANFATAHANPAQVEDQLKAPTQHLLHEVGEAFSLEIVTRTEAHSAGPRPDVGVTVNELPRPSEAERKPPS